MAQQAIVGDQTKAEQNYRRYMYGRTRGHTTFIRRARRNNNYYLGDGLQWSADDAATLTDQDRQIIEMNEIMPMVNTAVGYQIANRMDIAVFPRSHGADDNGAEVIGKVIKQIADSNDLPWKETEIFTDGMITSRGYFDVRMSFRDSLVGEPCVTTLPPDDVVPDPDANSYDPDEWLDVIVTRLYSLDEIEQVWGKKVRDKVDNNPDSLSNTGIEGGELEKRSQFGYEAVGTSFQDATMEFANDTRRFRVIDRQYRVYEDVMCAISATGDIRPIPNATKLQREAYITKGYMLMKRKQRRVKWCVSTNNVLMFDDYSPYPWFTVVPYFPYFRRGETRGLIDNAISLQELLNKTLSQFINIINTMAQSGWFVEEDSLADLKIEQFENEVKKNGVVISYKKGAAAPIPIKPAQIPESIVELLNQCIQGLRSVTGVSQSMTGTGPENEMSGVAYQARQYAAQQKLAIPLDNLGRTRSILAHRLLDLIQMYMDQHRVIRITGTDNLGNKTSTPLSVNEPVDSNDPNTDYLNDLTLGEYSLVISEQPMQITFENSQFEQVKSLAKDFGYSIPPAFALRYSNLSDKKEFADSLEQAQAQAQQPDPLTQAKALLAHMQAVAVGVDTMNKRIEAVFGATQAGAQIAAMPSVASIADEILQSAGFDDQNAPPIVPQTGAGLAHVAPAAPVAVPALPHNTHPNVPANPGVGEHAGIEKLGVQ